MTEHISPELRDISDRLETANRTLAKIAGERVAQRAKIERAQNILAGLDDDYAAAQDAIDGLTIDLVSRVRLEAEG